MSEGRRGTGNCRSIGSRRASRNAGTATAASAASSRRPRKLGLAVAAVATAGLALAASASAATLKADYTFQDTLTSSIPGAPELVNIGGANGFATESVDGRQTRVLTFPAGGGLVFPSTGEVSPDAYSTVISFRFADLDGYRRILDSLNGTGDSGLYQQDGFVDFYDGGDNDGADEVLFPNKYAELAFTRTAAKQLAVYVDGDQQLTFLDSADQAAILAGTLRFFNDGSGGATGEESAGAVSRIRVYDGALTAAEVRSISDASAPTASKGGKAKQKGKKKIKVATGITTSCPPFGAPCSVVAEVTKPSTSAGAAKKKPKLPKVLGTATSEQAAGGTGDLTVVLSKKASKAVRARKKTKVAISATITAPNGATATFERSAKLKGKKKKS